MKRDRPSEAKSSRGWRDESDEWEESGLGRRCGKDVKMCSYIARACQLALY